MSKRTKTQNFNFRTFTGTPMNQAATDFSENWREADAILKALQDEDSRLDSTLNARIDEEAAARESADNALGTRIDDLAQVVEDLSPESIEDFKTRLNAVEHKVATNSGLIALIQQKDTEQDELLANHEQRLANLETGLADLTEKHDADMAAVNEHLAAIDEEQLVQNGRIETLENECEACKHELNDLQSHIDGINDELVTVTNQMETLTTVVSDVTMKLREKQPIVLSEPIIMDGVQYTTVESLLAALARRAPSPTPTHDYSMDGENLHVGRDGFTFIPPEELDIHGDGDFNVDDGDLTLADKP